MTFSSGSLNIDAVAYTSWNASPHQAAMVSYSFLTTVPFEATTEDATGFAPLTANQQAAVRSALALWSAVANITFVEVSDNGGTNGQIRFGTNNQSAAQSAGYSDLPNDGVPNDRVYTYFDNSDSTNDSFAEGSYGRTTFIHEIGHAIGLKHPGNYNGQSGSGTPPYLPSNLDNTDYSIMSYNDGKSYALTGNSASTPMLLDIQAVQYLYGANTQYHTGNDTYSFGNTAAPQCIWDAGGTNTFDFSATTQGATIDLHAGSFSETRAGLNNVSIAYGVTIQNAIGGSGNDVIRANDGTDTINGGGGDDLVVTGLGNDTIDGGSGNDTVQFAGNQANYTVVRSGSNLVVTNIANGSNVATLNNVETLKFNDKTVSASSINSGSAPVVANPTHDVYAGVNQNFSTSVGGNIFSDADLGNGDVLHYSASLVGGQSLPSWLSINATTGVLSGVPGYAQLGTINVQVTATDNAANAVSTTLHISTILNAGQEFINSSGADTFTGSGGIDDVVYAGNRSSYTVTRLSDSTYTVAQAGGATDTLVNIDRLKFADATVAIDISGHGGEAYGLYQAAFNRTPDSGGVGYWTNILDQGIGLRDVANTFITSPEFVATYSTLNTTQFVSQIYLNVLHRPSDAGGLAYWANTIDTGANSRAQVLLFFTQGEEFQANLVQAVGNGFSYTPYLL